MSSFNYYNGVGHRIYTQARSIAEVIPISPEHHRVVSQPEDGKIFHQCKSGKKHYGSCPMLGCSCPCHTRGLR